MQLVPGRVVGSYEIISRAGLGGMGEVYRARDQRLGREVAIKILSSELGSDSAARLRFEREARTASNLNHPHILTIFDVGESHGPDGLPFYYIAMELIRGETLRQKLAASTPLNQLLEWLAQVADGLAKAHGAGMVHRDLKPENVMISEDGFAKIVDFGLAKVIDPIAPPLAAASDSTATALVTADGMILGTPGYMAPEQIEGRPADPRADIFALGCMLYEAIAGRRPFEGRSAIETLHNILYQPPPPVTRPIAPALSDLVANCLAKAPDDRCASAREVSLRLRELSKDRTSSSRVDVPTVDLSRMAIPPARSKRRWQIGAAILGALVVLTLLALALLREKNAAPDAKMASSLAILPVKVANADDEFLSDGVSEELVDALSRTEGLRVISSSSAARYRRKEINPAVVARELGVERLIVGNLVRRGDQLSFRLELLDAAGAQLWGKRYARDSRNFATLGGEAAKDVLLELRGAEAARAAGPRPQTTKPEAYTAYLRGKEQQKKATPAALKTAIELYNRAIELDPLFSPAHASLASAYSLQGTMGFVTPSSAFGKVKAAAGRALELDGANSQALWLLSQVAEDEGDERRADDLRRRALAANPNFVTAHFAEANRLLRRHQFEAAEAALRRVEELDPLKPDLPAIFGWNLYFEREYDRSILHLRRAIELFPDFPNSYAYLAFPLIEKGRHAEAIVAIEKAISLSDNPSLVAWRAYVLARAGRAREARQLAAKLREISSERYVVHYYQAGLYAALGDRDEAFAMLRRARDDHDWRIKSFARKDPALDMLRSDPRWREIVPN